MYTSNTNTNTNNINNIDNNAGPSMQDLMSLIMEQSKLISSLQKTIESLNVKLELSENINVKGAKDVISKDVVKDVDLVINVDKKTQSQGLDQKSL